MPLPSYEELTAAPAADALPSYEDLTALPSYDELTTEQPALTPELQQAYDYGQIGKEVALLPVEANLRARNDRERAFGVIRDKRDEIAALNKAGIAASDAGDKETFSSIAEFQKPAAEQQLADMESEAAQRFGGGPKVGEEYGDAAVARSIAQAGETPPAFQSGALALFGGLEAQAASLARHVGLDSIGDSLAEDSKNASTVANVAQGTSADIARGVGDVAALMAGPQKLMLLTAALRGAGAAETEALNAGASQEEAHAAALKTFPQLFATLLAGGATAKAIEKILPKALPAALKGGAQFMGAAGANVATDMALHELGDQPYGTRALTADVLFAALPGLHGYERAKAEELIRQAKGEPNAIENTSAGTPDGGLRPRSEIQELPTQEGSEGIQPSRQGELAAEAQPEASQEVSPRQKLKSVEEEMRKATSDIEALRVLDISPNRENTALDLHNIEIDEDSRGEGFGSKALKRITDIADKHGVRIELEVADEAGIDTPSWYKRNGFEWSDEGGFMVREPKGVPERNLGPGAANIEELQNRPLREIGAYNADVDARRAARGAEPLFSAAREAAPETWDKAVERVEQDPELPTRLITEINEGKRKSVTREDQTAILWKVIDLENRRLDAEEKAANPEMDPADREAYREEFSRLDNELNAAEEANRKAGTFSATALNIRRLIATENFTYARMLRRAELTKGEPLTEPERAEIKKQSEGILRTENELAAKQPDSPEAKVDESIRAIEEEAKKNPQFTPEVMSLADRIVARLDKAADAALARLRSKFARASAGVDPTILIDVVTFGASKIAKGLVKFSQWSAAMVRDLGEDVKPYLEEAWTGANKHIDDRVNMAAPRQRQAVKEAVTKEKVVATADTIGEDIKTRVAEGAKLSELRPTVRKLTETIVRGGIKGREAVVDAVHERLKAVDPKITRRQTMDLMSGYGDFKKLNPDAVKAEVRDIAQQLQLVAKIEDVQAKVPLKKSGVERQTLSDESRRLTQELNENIKKLGVVVSDPASQLRTILAAQETRLTNRIKDLKAEIAAGEQRIKTKTAPPTSEKIEALKRELAEVEKEHENTFRKDTEAQKLKNAVVSAKRAEAVEAARLEKAKRGIFEKPLATAKLRSAELDAIRARTEAARAERIALEDAANPPLSEAQKRLDSALVARERWEQLLAGEIAPAKKLAPEALSQLEEDARAEIAAMRELASDLRKQAKPPVDEQAVKAEALKKSIEELERRIREGDLAAKGKKQGPDSEAVTKLREQRDQLQKQLDEARKAARPAKDENLIRENAQVKALEKAAAEFERRLNDSDFTGKGKTQGPDTARVSQARGLRDAAKAAFDAAHEAANPGPSAEQKKINAIKAALLRRNVDIAERIAKGEFEPRKKPPAVSLDKDPEAVAAKAENERLKKQFAQKQFEWQQAQRSKGRKAIDFVKDVMGASRSIITSADVSAPFRQGGFLLIGDMVTHPVRAAKQMGSMIKQLMSEGAFEKAQAQLALRPNADLYKKSGLYFADLDSNLTAREENMKSNLAEKLKIPWLSAKLDKIPYIGKTLGTLTNPGRIVRASNRAYTGFLNRQRADAFDALVDSLGGKDKISDADAKMIAKAVNIFTGRGTAAGFEKSANAMATYLFSPRFLTSRFQTLLGHPIAGAMGTGVSMAARRAVARQYAKFAGGLAVILGLGWLAGAKIEKDPRSSDFGKMRFGDTRIDPLAGLQQIAVLLSRTATRTQKVGEQLKPVTGDTYYRFARSKLAPIPGAALNFFTRKNVVGEKVTAAGIAEDLLVPMSYQDVGKIYKEHGPLKGTIMEMLNLLGMGLQDYQKK